MIEDALALAFRTGLPFVGLRDHQHDPELDRLIPPDAARAARGVPLEVTDGHLRLAVADPEADIAALAPYLNGLRVELAIAAHEELEAILGPPPPEPLVAEPPIAQREGLAHEPLAAGLEAAGEDPAEPLERAEPLGADPEAARQDTADSLGATAEAAEAEPVAAAREAGEPEAAEAEPREPLAAEPDAAVPAPPEHPPAEPLVAEPQAAGQEPAELLGAQPEAADDAPREPLAAELDTPAAFAAEPEAGGQDAEALAGAGVAEDEAAEVPSWLEPPRRGRRVLVALLVLVILLIVAAGAVVAYVLAR